MQKPFKILDAGIYPFEIGFFNGDSRKKCLKAINSYNSYLGKQLEEDGFLTDSSLASFYSFDTGASFIWISKKAKGDMSVISHELFHAVAFIARRIRLGLTNDSEEAFAYLTEYLMKQVVEHLKE